MLEAKNLHSFLLGMLRLNPEERSTAQTILQHPWLQALPSNEVHEFVARSSLATGAMPALVQQPDAHESEGRDGRSGRGAGVSDRTTLPVPMPLAAPVHLSD